MASKTSALLLAAAGVAAASQTETAFVSGAAPSLRRSPVVHAAGVTATEASSSSLTAAFAVAGLGAAAAVVASRRPATVSSKKVTAVCAFENELGVQAPVGFWDPAGFCTDGDQTDFFRRRVVELKHGRVAMLACIGYIVPEYAKFPGYLSPSTKTAFADVPTGLNALSKVPAVGIFQWVVFCGICDLWLVHQVPTNPPGKLATRLFGGSVTNYEYGFLGVPGYLGGKPVADPELKKKKLNAELANGRLAMMAIIGMFFQDGLTGSAWGDWALFTASPLRSTEVRAFENELGVQPPVGFWDPAGFCTDGDQQDFFRRRVIELKHGRVAMLACIGYIVPEYARFPGFLSPSTKTAFADIGTGLHAFEKVPAVGIFQWVIFCGICDLWLVHQVPTNPPGKLATRLFGGSVTNYEYGFLGVPGYLGGKPIADPELKKKKLNAELANGRLAMMAIIGMFFQDGLTGSAWGDWANFTASPLRAFENELGVQAPVGFWDPLGFTVGGDAASFRRRRYVELKHGRVAMIACLGYIVPEYSKFDGYLSPSLNLKFSDVPTGFAAFSKVPLSGWAQMITFAGTVELFQYVDDPTRAPGDFKNAGFLGVPNGFLRIKDEATKKKKLSAEIANGRLAMMAIIGMFFQNGLTGEAWGDWSLYTDSPLRSSTALNASTDILAGTGGPLPEMMWDPAGISKGKTEEEMLQLRAMELKHGRTAMLACLGWFHVAAGWHPIGDFAAGEHLSNDPLVNLTQLSMGGAMQVVFTIMCAEWLTTYVCKPPAEKPWDILGWTDVIADENYPDWKKAQLQELNNGRLAMIAIVGLIFQDAYTGDYVAGVGQACGGAEVCKHFSEWPNVFPPAPYDPEPLYPKH
jgi:hypothetical protein